MEELNRYLVHKKWFLAVCIAKEQNYFLIARSTIAVWVTRFLFEVLLQVELCLYSFGLSELSICSKKTDQTYFETKFTGHPRSAMLSVFNLTLQRISNPKPTLLLGGQRLCPPCHPVYPIDSLTLLARGLVEFLNLLSNQHIYIKYWLISFFLLLFPDEKTFDLQIISSSFCEQKTCGT